MIFVAIKLLFTFGREMRVVIFFTYLCFLLISGNKYVFTGTHHNYSHYSPAENINIGQQLKSADTNPEVTIIEVTDVEDEDASTFLVRKYKLQDRYYLTAPSSFYLHKCFKAPPPLVAYLSSIYLTQGVLKI
ncbi:hypothetical protein [Chitinophaga sp. MM2321]|uniref:hypothetical protein n=1 Tax=Chitinophaga sp. MM2321 TaxID=3137178 RepID=UPI0032D57B1C